MDVQHLYIVGRATQDAELLSSKSKTKAKKFAVFGVAANRYLGKDKEPEASFFDCICFLPSAEKMPERIKKGDRIMVQGRPTAEAYINKDKEAVGKIRIVVEDWEVLK